MVAQIKHLTLVQLRNLFGLNTFRYTKDTKAKNTTKALAIVYVLLFAMAISYVCGLVYGYVYLGASEIVPAYLVLVSSMLVLVFGFFKAGPTIFGKSSYEILCSLPVSKTAIVVSRFLKMYVEYLLLCVLVMVPGMITYGVLCKPGVLFYGVGLLNVFVAPLFPMGVATFIGAAITWISSRMKRKSMVSSLLVIIVVVGVLFLSSNSGQMATVTKEQIANLVGMFTELIEQFYPVAIWLGGAMVGESLGFFLLGIVVSLAVAVGVIVLVSLSFYSVMQKLHGTSAKHDYRMETLESSHVLMALCKKEFKRYFASSIYVTNTIMGPLLGTVLSIVLIFVSVETIMAELPPLPINMNLLIPIFMAGTFSMMPPVCVSLSMEGNNWWILKTLPIPAKTIYDAKILMNLLLMLPFYVVSVICLMIGLKPTMGEAILIVVLPAVFALFTCVFGIRANLWFHSFDLTDEVKIVKQSTPAAVGGFAGILLMFVMGVATVLTSLLFPGRDMVVVCVLLSLCVIVLGVGVFVYQANNRRELP